MKIKTNISAYARDEHGTWDVCGGGLEWGMTLEQNMHQEMLEEFNITTKSPLHFLRLKEAFRTDESGDKTHWLSIGYLVILSEEEVSAVRINEPDKFDELGWFNLDNLPTPLHSLITPELITLIKNTYAKVTAK
jgi:ADP-ribose pyrophosphatase YjhB (NUDIX family)